MYGYEWNSWVKKPESNPTFELNKEDLYFSLDDDTVIRQTFKHQTNGIFHGVFFASPAPEF